MSHYFAADGNYGDALDLVVVDTADWSDEDWALIDEAFDGDRPKIAEEITKRHTETKTHADN